MQETQPAGSYWIRRFVIVCFFLALPCNGQSVKESPSRSPTSNTACADHPLILTGSGTTNYLPLWTNASNLSSSIIYQLSNNVGIGTTAPQAKLDVNGGINANGIFTGNGGGLTGIQFSQLSGTLTSPQLSGIYSSAVTLSSSFNVYYGDGSHLTGVGGGGGGGTFVNTNYPAVNLPTQAGQQVALGAIQLPAGVFNMVNQSFDVWAAITWNPYINGGSFQANLYLCNTPTCSGQSNAVLGYAPEAQVPNPAPAGIGVRASYAITAAGASASAVGSEAVQVDMGARSGSSSYSISNEQSQPFDSTESLYFVVVIYMDSVGTMNGTPTAQMNALRLSIAYY
jgi:hypothetical protein